MDGTLPLISFFENTTQGEDLGRTLGPFRWIFLDQLFIILKSSYQDPSNEGSNFISSPLEDGH